MSHTHGDDHAGWLHVEDITERKALEAELLQQARHDPLTGLPNRALLAERMTQALTTRGRHARPDCLLYVDVNGFKAVNDAYGHTVGDLLLQQLAGRITAQLRPDDTAARIGGDEFAVLCVDTEPDQAEAIGDRLRAAVARPFTLDGHEVQVTAAVGVSVPLPRDRDGQPIDLTDLLREADRRMYDAKRDTGRPPAEDPDA